MKAYKKVPDYKKHNETTKRTMRVTRVVFSVSPYQLIVKYVFDLLLVDCCMKLVYFIVCIYLCDAKNVSELMKNSIKRKYGSNGCNVCNGSNGSNGKNNVDNKEFCDQ